MDKNKPEDKTLFEKIADKEIPSYIVWEDDNYMAFLTIEPYSDGHTLVIPKKNEGDYIFTMNDDVYAGLMEATKKVAAIIDSKMPSDRIVMWVQGFEVPHVHVHLVPSIGEFNINQSTGKRPSDQELKKVHEKLTS